MLKFRDVAARVCGDRVRILTAPLVIAWLVWLSARYAHFSVVAQPGYAGCLADPPSCEDHTLYMALWRVVDVGEGSYRIRKAGRTVPIAGRVGALAVGDTVSVEGTFDVQKSRVVEVRRELHVLRPLKRGFGALGLVLLLMAVPRVFVWRAGRLALRG